MDATFFESFSRLPLPGGFTLVRLAISPEPLSDALGREALARTTIIGTNFYIVIRSGLSDAEVSVSIYHEVLEAALVAALDPPPSLLNFNEGDFEQAAYRAHRQLRMASPQNVGLMLQSHGFR